MNDRYYFNSKRDPVKAHDDDYIYDDRLDYRLPTGILSWVVVTITSITAWFISFLKIKL